jgi:hypothetical protein
MKNITLSAPEELIERARQKAVAKGTTLNSEFRDWPEAQVMSDEEHVAQYRQLLKDLSHVNAGRKFTRDELNEH